MLISYLFSLKSVNFSPIFGKSVNFEHFVNGWWTHLNTQSWIPCDSWRVSLDSIWHPISCLLDCPCTSMRGVPRAFQKINDVTLIFSLQWAWTTTLTVMTPTRTTTRKTSSPNPFQSNHRRWKQQPSSTASKPSTDPSNHQKRHLLSTPIPKLSFFDTSWYTFRNQCSSRSPNKTKSILKCQRWLYYFIN